ncbi:MAG: Gfo/Idh/MocA family oxidoreductase [Burkholderiales bacterium]
MLLIGHSRIGQRRVLPALRALPQVSAIAVASRRWRPAPQEAAGAQVFADYEDAIARSGAGLAYVSLENSDHALWAERALAQGMHVVVDKPAFLTAADARRLAALARERGRCLAEATVFTHHPQIEALRRSFGGAGAQPTRVVAVFSFPPLDPADFRYRRDRGGGALYDLGPYAAATSRVLFGRAPRNVSCEVLSRRTDGIDTAFSVLMTYDGGGSLAGHFGFDTEYQNRILALGPGVSAELDRAFTLAPEAGNRLLLRRANVASEIALAPADAFERFLGAVFRAIGVRQWDGFPEALRADAELLESMRTIAGTG